MSDICIDRRIHNIFVIYIYIIYIYIYIYIYSQLWGTKYFSRKIVDVEMGGCHFFITLQSIVFTVCGGESKVSFITFWFLNLLS